MMVLAAFESTWNRIVRAGHVVPLGPASITITWRGPESRAQLGPVRVKRTVSPRVLAGGDGTGI